MIRVVRAKLHGIRVTGADLNDVKIDLTGRVLLIVDGGVFSLTRARTLFPLSSTSGPRGLSRRESRP